ncbi:MAG: hypothetical protein KF795_18550 [Labilithrix sp.]|nr:hypothetical protein [Labilithrix sp.]
MRRWSILLAPLFAACGLSVTGVAPPDDGDAGPNGGRDGSAPVGDGAIGDGDGGIGDGAAGDADASAGGWCATQPPHEICVDFDDGQIILATSAFGAAPSAIDDTQSRSAPSSLRSEAEAIGATSYAYQSWGGSRSVVDLAFDVLVEGAGYAQIGGVELFPTTGYRQLLFEYDNGSLAFIEFANGVKTPHTLAAPAAGWHRLELHAELEPVPARSKVVVKQDGLTYFDGELASGHGMLTNVKADVGIVYCGKSLPVKLFVDNVTIDSQP